MSRDSHDSDYDICVFNDPNGFMWVVELGGYEVAWGYSESYDLAIMDADKWIYNEVEG